MTPDEAATWQAIAGVVQAVGAIAALAVAVGVPIYQQKQERKVRVKVTPVLGWLAGGFLSVRDSPRIDELVAKHGRPMVAFEIENLSAFAITVHDVGLCEGDPAEGLRASMALVLQPKMAALPHRLEPMSEATFLCDATALNYSFTTRTGAYARSGGGVVATGTSPAFLWFCDQLLTARKQSRLVPDR